MRISKKMERARDRWQRSHAFAILRTGTASGLFLENRLTDSFCKGFDAGYEAAKQSFAVAKAKKALEVARGCG